MRGSVARRAAATTMQRFLEETASQLTYHGLVSLHEGVRERQLCVLFRNNHFSTLFKLNDQLFLLMTDQGYQAETNIVWETFSGLDNDVSFVTGAPQQPAT
jgi:hypothetical protein